MASVEMHRVNSRQNCQEEREKCDWDSALIAFAVAHDNAIQ